MAYVVRIKFTPDALITEEKYHMPGDLNERLRQLKMLKATMSHVSWRVPWNGDELLNPGPIDMQDFLSAMLYDKLAAERKLDEKELDGGDTSQ